MTTTTSNIKFSRASHNCDVVWLDNDINETNDDFRNFITNFQQIVNNVYTFTNADEFVDFITDMTDENMFMIILEALSYDIIPISEHLSQIKFIHILSDNELLFEKFTKLSFKVKSASKDTISIYQALQEACKYRSNNAMSISFIKPIDMRTKHNIDTLDCSFMYTQLLKEILITIVIDQSGGIHTILYFILWSIERYV